MVSSVRTGILAAVKPLTVSEQRCMKSLLLVAHSSRRTEPNLEIGRLSEPLAAKAAAEFALVEHAFIKLAAVLPKLAH